MDRAIFRVDKLSGAGSCQASGRHLERIGDVANVDPRRTHLNQRLVGSGDLLAAVRARHAVLPRKVATNAVWALEHVLSASPRFFDASDDAVRAAWMDASVRWLERTYGAANVVAVTLHLDESTPHLHGVVVPIVVKRTRGVPDVPSLSARSYINGDRALSALQDDYHACVAHLGLARGVRGARITYPNLRQRYAAMTEQPPAAGLVLGTITLPPPAAGTAPDLRTYALGEQARLRAAVGPELERLAARADELARERERQDAQIAALERQLAAAQALAARAQVVDLEAVLRRLGGRRDKDKAHRWALGGVSIGLDGRGFYDVDTRASGVGAIELVRHLTGYDHGQALAYLVHELGARDAASAAGEHAAHGAALVRGRGRGARPSRPRPRTRAAGRRCAPTWWGAARCPPRRSTRCTRPP